MLKSVLVCAASIIIANAGTIYQSTDSVTVANPFGGTIVGYQGFLAARFTLDSAAQITGLGGDIGIAQADRSLFVTLIQLSGPSALPSNTMGDPFADSMILVSRTFTPTVGQAADVLIPVSLSIGPGTYAIVFGGGLFGATGTGTGFMPHHSTQVMAAGDFLTWGNRLGGSDPAQATWLSGPFNPSAAQRFFVVGEVPEPSAFVLPSLACVIFLWKAHTRNRMNGKCRERGQAERSVDQPFPSPAQGTK